MKLLLTGTAIIALMFIIMMLWMARASKSGQPPGLSEGKLLTCASHKNCVCTEVGGSIPPEPPVALNRRYDSVSAFIFAIDESGGVVVRQTEDYLAATYQSTLFGFIDDVELRLDNERQLLHIRSASRQGKSDLGVNRKRLAMLKAIISNRDSQ